MSKWICPTCGEVEPTKTWYTEPATAECPICGKEFDDGTKMKVLKWPDAIKKRPKMWENVSDEDIKKILAGYNPDNFSVEDFKKLLKESLEAYNEKI
jgi:hypothetical protein